MIISNNFVVFYIIIFVLDYIFETNIKIFWTFFYKSQFVSTRIIVKILFNMLKSELI